MIDFRFVLNFNYMYRFCLEIFGLNSLYFFTQNLGPKLYILVLETVNVNEIRKIKLTKIISGAQFNWSVFAFIFVVIYVFIYFILKLNKLMVGSVDLRVPPSQGIEYYKALMARNVPAKLAVFKDDNHPLDKPQTTMDCIILTLLWYEKYLS